MTQTLPPGIICLADCAKLVRMVAHLVASRTRPAASVALRVRVPFSCDPDLIPPWR